MDRARFSTLAHAPHRFLGPVSPERAGRLLDALAVPPGGRALDLGCGKGEFLIRLAERSGCGGLGVDVNRAFLDAARAEQARRVPGAPIEWREADARALACAPASFDAALCVGASHALGGYLETLRALTRWTAPGGRLLLGEGFWGRDPDPGYLEALGATRDEMTDHAGNLERGVATGLVPLACEASSRGEWDAYEDAYAAAIERFAADHPDDPDAGAMRERIGAWRAAYRRWGRDTLGFGFYLFERPRP